MKHIHFIGIGGIGVSALARYYLEKGYPISGSDLYASEITDYFKKRKVKVFIGKHKASNIGKGVFMAIYSPAVTKNNPERKQALKMGVKLRSYPEALGELSREHFTIAVAGTHGKSTIASMIGLLLEEAGLDPTVIVGTKLNEFGNSNCRVGKSKYLVIEACEHLASFLNYWPEVIVLASIESDHLDYYKTFPKLLKSFDRFIDHLPKKGIIVANKDDKNVMRILKKKRYKIVTYSLKDNEASPLKKILKVPGDFNASNALASLKVGRLLNIPDMISLKSLSRYKSSWRRFDVRELSKPINFTLIDDYGHHPTQVKLTLKAAREKFRGKKIWCIYQPHQYQRTFYLFNDFVKTFKESSKHIDKIIITNIYSVSGREKESIKKKIDSKKLVKAINKNNVSYIEKKKLEKFLKEQLKESLVLIIMGAGDIYNLSLKLRKYEEKV